MENGETVIIDVWVIWLILYPFILRKHNVNFYETIQTVNYTVFGFCQMKLNLRLVWYVRI